MQLQPVDVFRTTELVVRLDSDGRYGFRVIDGPCHFDSNEHRIADDDQREESFK